MKTLDITCYTDPCCVWCWAMEPVFRALETRYPGDISIRYVMGGMVEDIRRFEDEANGIGSDLTLVNRQIADHWLEAAPIHGMPVMAEDLRLFSGERLSTYPPSIAYKAAQIASPEKADLYLRLLRDAAFTRALPINDPDVIAQLAREAGLDMPAFEKALKDGSAERAFMGDLGLTRATGVGVFPTFRLKTARARQMYMRGYQRYEDFQRAFRQLLGDDLQPLPSPPDEEVLLWLIRNQGRLAFEELCQAFDFDSRAQAERWAEGLIQSGLLQKEQAGTGWFVRAVG